MSKRKRSNVGSDNKSDKGLPGGSVADMISHIEIRLPLMFRIMPGYSKRAKKELTEAFEGTGVELRFK